MIGLTVTGDEALIARLGALPAKISAAARTSLDAWATELADYIRSDKLSGDPLHRRSGTLSASVRPIPTGETGRISAGAGGGKNVPYARAHEYGIQRNVVVSAYHRMQTMAWGKPISPIEVLVNQHSSYINLPERSYMRSALRDEAPSGIADLKAAISEAIAA